jgi:hypothetical protein
MIMIRIALLFLLSIISFAWFIPGTSLPLTEGLVAYYSFNQCDARDDSGNGSDGKMHGGIACWCGIEGDALLFDGNDDWVAFEGMVNNYFTTSDFTISFYIKPERYTIFKQNLLSKRHACDLEQILDTHIDFTNKEINTEIYQTDIHYYRELSPQLDSLGWMHFAIVREGFRAQTYVNGQLKNQSFRCSGVDITNEATLSFSNSPCIDLDGIKRFKGVLDELRVYDRALSEEEILLLYEEYPIENAARDCVTFAPQKLPNPLESGYLCAV